MAVVAMAILGALVTGVFFTALREQRDGRDAVHRVQALGAAEYGLAAALSPSSWRRGWNVTRRRGQISVASHAPDAGTSYSVALWKLNGDDFLLVSSGAAGSAPPLASRRVALLVTLRAPVIATRAAVTAMNGVYVQDSSLVMGVDTLPDGWECPPPDVARPAVILPAASLFADTACTSALCVIGAPAVASDTLAASMDTYESFGSVQRDSIASAALQLTTDAALTDPAPSLDGMGECDASRADNLGDPLRVLGASSPCADYLPVLHAPGNMRIDGGAGQGLLLVDGDLTIAGGARFSGVASVRGVLEITEASELHGAILASRVIVRDGSHARYSSCAAERALRAAAEPVVPEGLAWSEMY
jgi:hypothetical protein